MNDNIDDSIISAADMMSKIFGDGFASRALSSKKIVRAWYNTVIKIRGTGEQLAAHTNVVDLNGDALIIETDHSAWSQLLQLHSAFILRGLSYAFPEVKIKSLVFRIKK